MTSAAIGKLLDSYLTGLEGEDGFWRGMREDVQIFVMSDDAHDRMRIMAPIGELKDLEPRVLQVLLEANYDRALDAKYAMRGREVWSVSVHPLATLAPDDFAGFIEQVVRLVKNTGSTYASSDLVFGGGQNAADGDEEGEDDADAGRTGDDESQSS
ncbi:MAG: type III secretion system chaperone [Candidatus Eisenbacteria bacterium]|nr:type III secretion system chaperone [Candidatus Eisenbacteria bacterium]